MKFKSFIGPQMVSPNGQVVFINPGSGPVVDSDLERARENIVELIKDAGFEPDEVEIIRNESDDQDGRYGFAVKHGDHSCDVRMPGIPLEDVRYTNSKTQNIWHYPRLYVDGSSYVWKYALNLFRDTLNGFEE